MPDTNYNDQYARQTGLRVTGVLLEPADPEKFDDIFKLSQNTDCHFSDVVVRAGNARENAVDINNRSTGIEVEDFYLSGGRQCAVVVKGGSDVKLSEGTIDAHPASKYDIELGGWSDQSMKPSTLVIDSVVKTDESPIRVVVGWWRLPTVINSKVEILWLRSLGYHVYNLVKFLF